MTFTDFFQRNYGFEYYEFVKFYGIGPCLEIAVIELENKVTSDYFIEKTPQKLFEKSNQNMWIQVLNLS